MPNDDKQAARDQFFTDMGEPYRTVHIMHAPTGGYSVSLHEEAHALMHVTWCKDWGLVTDQVAAWLSADDLAPFESVVAYGDARALLIESARRIRFIIQSGLNDPSWTIHPDERIAAMEIIDACQVIESAQD